MSRVAASRQWIIRLVDSRARAGWGRVLPASYWERWTSGRKRPASRPSLRASPPCSTRSVTEESGGVINGVCPRSELLWAGRVGPGVGMTHDVRNRGLTRDDVATAYETIRDTWRYSDERCQRRRRRRSEFAGRSGRCQTGRPHRWSAPSDSRSHRSDREDEPSIRLCSRRRNANHRGAAPVTAQARIWAEIRYEEVANGWETAPNAAKHDWLHELEQLVTDPTVCGSVRSTG